MNDSDLKELSRALERLEDINKKILKQLEQQSADGHFVARVVEMATGIVLMVAVWAGLAFIHQQYHWF